MAPKCGSSMLQMWICPNSVPKFLIRCQKVLCYRVAGESHDNFFHQPVMWVIIRVVTASHLKNHL